MPQIELIRPLELAPTGGSELTIENRGSGNVYYGRTSSVGPSENIGTLHQGETLTLEHGFVWVVAEAPPAILDLREKASALGSFSGTVTEAQLPKIGKFPIGITWAGSEPYGAKMDGVTDDTAAFKALHEAINAGTIKGYYVTSTARVAGGTLPIITKGCEIRFFGGAQLDMSENFSHSAFRAAIQLEASYGAEHELTAEAKPGEYTLKVGTPYSERTILKIADKETDWDPAGTHSRVGEMLEVGVPDGFLTVMGSTEPEATTGTAAVGVSEIPLTGAEAKGFVVNAKVLFPQVTKSVTKPAQSTEYWIVHTSETGIELATSKEGAAFKVTGHALEAAGTKLFVTAGSKAVAGTTYKTMMLTNENPVLNLEKAEKHETGGYVWPATGELEAGTEKFAYTAMSWGEPFGSGNFIAYAINHKFENAFNQGFRVKLVEEAGTVYLRTPISHESAYTVAHKSAVASLPAIRNARLENVSIKGPVFGEGIIGIRLAGAINCTINQPTIENCLGMALSFVDCWDCHITDPWVENARELNLSGSGGRAYGISFGQATQDCSVRGGRTRRTRHTYTQGGSGLTGSVELAACGLPRRNTIWDHEAYATSADGYDSHGGAVDVTLVRCTSRQANGSGFNMNCAQATLIACRAERSSGNGVACGNQSIGVTEYDIDCQVLSPAKIGIVIPKGAAGVGETVRRIRIRGSVDSAPQFGVVVQGVESVYKMKNVDIDVQVSNGPSAVSGQNAYAITDAENVRLRPQASGISKNNTAISLTRVTGFTVARGFLSWAEAGGSGHGILATECEQGMIEEGPMINRGGKSTKLEATTKKVDVYPGNEGVESVEGTAEHENRKLTLP